MIAEIVLGVALVGALVQIARLGFRVAYLRALIEENESFWRDTDIRKERRREEISSLWRRVLDQDAVNDALINALGRERAEKIEAEVLRGQKLATAEEIAAEFADEIMGKRGDA